jgi:hypothetical protein
VAARAAAARCGGARRGQQRPASGGRGCWRARGAERSGAWQLELGNTGGEDSGVGRREKQREEGLDVDDED